MISITSEYRGRAWNIHRYRGFGELRTLENGSDIPSIVPAINKKVSVEDILSERRNKAWYGFGESAQEVFEVAQTQGWKEGLDKMENMRMLVAKGIKLDSVQRQAIWGRTGSALNPVRAMSGSSKPWRKFEASETTKRQSKRGAAYHVVVDIGASANVSTEVFFWRGAVASVLAEAMVKSGRRVALSFVASGRLADSFMTFIVDIKGFTDPFDSHKASMGSLPGFFRTYGLLAMCRSPESINGSSIGISESISEEMLTKCFSGNILLIKNIWSEYAAKCEIKSLVEGLRK